MEEMSLTDLRMLLKSIARRLQGVSAALLGANP